MYFRALCTAHGFPVCIRLLHALWLPAHCGFVHAGCPRTAHLCVRCGVLHYAGREGTAVLALTVLPYALSCDVVCTTMLAPTVLPHALDSDGGGTAVLALTVLPYALNYATVCTTMPALTVLPHALDCDGVCVAVPVLTALLSAMATTHTVVQFAGQGGQCWRRQRRRRRRATGVALLAATGSATVSVPKLQ